MTNSNVDPWSLILEHKYLEAAAIYERELIEDPNDPGALGGHAVASLCLGNLKLALTEFRQANELESVPGVPLCAYQPYLTDIGKVLWLLGRHNDAIATFKTAVDGITNGTIRYADLAGGVSQGLLLWYAAVGSGQTDLRYHAGEYLHHRLQSSDAWYWPGPVAAYVMDLAKQEVLLAAACGSSELAVCEERAKTDLLARRQLVQAIFYMAVKKRRDKQELECKALMARCAALENPIIEHEWYLAKAEASRPLDAENAKKPTKSLVPGRRRRGK